MRAEIAKFRYLPLPRVTFAVVALLAVAIGVGVLSWSPDSSSDYVNIPTLLNSQVVLIGALILGVWMATLDFAAGTLQRTLTAESDRNHVLVGKLVVVLVGVAALGVVAAAISGGLINLATVHNDVDLSQGTLARQFFSPIPAAVAGGVIGFGFGLLARAMGGGITLALAFVFVLSGALELVPSIRDLTFGSYSNDLTTHLAGSGKTTHGAVVAALGTIVWSLIVVVPGWVRFVRDDLK